MPHTMREDARVIMRTALKAADPFEAVNRGISLENNRLVIGQREISLKEIDRIIAVGGGKAGAPMARALEAVLGDRLEGGLVVVKDGHAQPTAKIEIIAASHPVPDQRGVEGAKRIAELLRAADGRTLAICLISGGGSALLPAPNEGISLADKQETTRLLLGCGAEIGEINSLRKHLSFLKGGGLARLAAPAKVASLIISDVVGDHLDTIASGPTVPDRSSFSDCLEIIGRYGLEDRIPPAVRERLKAGAGGAIPDTPKPGEPELAGIPNLIIAGNRHVLEAAEKQASQLGYTPLILSSTIEGETADIARMHCAMLKEAMSHGQPCAPPCCLISGGETTVTLGEASGKGGRNQEFALVCARELAGLSGVLAASLGTDGTDGPTDAAGAMADGHSRERAERLGLSLKEHLARHDAYHFFQAIEGLVITGPTYTNVMDLRLMMAGMP